jgi:hypothetical protein
LVEQTLKKRQLQHARILGWLCGAGLSESRWTQTPCVPSLESWRDAHLQQPFAEICVADGVPITNQLRYVTLYSA